MSMTRINIMSVKLIRERSVLYEHKSINRPQEAHDLIQTVLDLNSEAVEKFGIIALTTKNKIAGIHIISVGSLNAAVVHPREVFKSAILNNAASLVCFHNHPSGDPTPSAEDIALTKRLAEAGEIMGIDMLDHIITGDGRFVSLKELGAF